MHVELVRTATEDGLRLDGALRARLPGATHRLSVDAVLCLPGVAGNFYTSSTFDGIVPQLRDLGLAVLTGNTRGHDSVFMANVGGVPKRLGAAYEIVDDCRYDVAAWLELLTLHGYERVVLLGHSLGAIKAVYSQASQAHPAVRAVIALSPPRLSYPLLVNSPESSLFSETLRGAEKLAAEGRGDELFLAKSPYPLLISAAAYLDKYGKADRYDLLNFAGKLSCPTLFTYGSRELKTGGSPFAGIVDTLHSLPGSPLREIATIDRADHFYTGCHDLLATTLVQWLENKFAVQGG
jgi:pimeloyl-ACP methyl ester carboxylesterase